MTDHIEIAKVPAGITLTQYHLDTLLSAFRERGHRPFTADEVQRFVEKGIIDVTNLEEMDISFSIGEADTKHRDHKYSVEDTIEVVFDPSTPRP